MDKEIFNNTEKQTAWVKFDNSQLNSQNTKIYNQCRMFYGYNKKSFHVKVYDGETLLFSDSLRNSDYFTFKTWNFTGTPAELKFEFEGTQSPEFYGFALDGLRGIAVDNIPLRGCSGLIFSLMDLTLLQQMYNYLNVKLILLQFGGNRVPYDSTTVYQYKKYFKYQLNLLKKICPDVPIIVIGPSDMSVKEKDSYITHNNLIPVRDAIREASLESGCAYWDMFEAMGGVNSMPSWVFADPPLAEKDFTHFTPNGAKIVTKMFYSAFIYEYNKYLTKIVK
jgi:hypothetical protein